MTPAEILVDRDISQDKFNKPEKTWTLKPTTINHFTGKPLRKSSDHGRYAQTKAIVEKIEIIDCSIGQ